MNLRYNPRVFTGLVHSMGTIARIEPRPEGKCLALTTDLEPAQLGLGASVAVSGVCLTVTDSGTGRFQADAAFETLERSTLGRLTVGDRVNLEPSLRLGDPLGGHLVSGHVDGVCTLRTITDRGDARELWFDVVAGLMRFVAPKGSVCVDGVSLTVNDVDEGGFVVGLVPHTLRATTLGELAPGKHANLEVDILARYVARLIETAADAADTDTSGVTLEQLANAGFISPASEGRP